MAIRRLMALSAVALAAMMAAAAAGPCAPQIDQMQAQIDAKLEAIAAAGPFMREGAFAGMSDQPTPRSIAAAEVRRGEISAQKAAAVRQAMARARAADSAGDARACKAALAQVRRAIGR